MDCKTAMEHQPKVLPESFDRNIWNNDIWNEFLEPEDDDIEFDMEYDFRMASGNESDSLCDKFQKPYYQSVKEKNINHRIELLRQAIDAYKEAKEWHYNHSKNGILYFYNRYVCFEWEEKLKAKLKFQLNAKDYVIPWILENAQKGFIQNDIYKQFADCRKGDLRKLIDELVSQSKITKVKKGSHFYISVSVKNNVLNDSEAAFNLSEQADQIIEYFSRKFPEVKVSRESYRTVTTVYFMINNKRIGRLRFSIKNKIIRYDYTDLATGKISFFKDLSVCEKIISKLSI